MVDCIKLMHETQNDGCINFSNDTKRRKLDVESEDEKKGKEGQYIRRGATKKNDMWQNHAANWRFQNTCEWTNSWNRQQDRHQNLRRTTEDFHQSCKTQSNNNNNTLSTTKLSQNFY